MIKYAFCCSYYNQTQQWIRPTACPLEMYGPEGIWKLGKTHRAQGEGGRQPQVCEGEPGEAACEPGEHTFPTLPPSG